MRLNLTPLGIMNFFFMLGTSFVLTFDDKMFKENYYDVRMYRFFLEVSPQEGYGIVAFLTACIFFSAFILKNRKLEVVGLGISGLLLIFILSGYLLTFPNIGSVALFVWTISTFMTIMEIIYKEQDAKRRRERVLYDIEKRVEKKQILIDSELSYNELERTERMLLIQRTYDIERLNVLEGEAEKIRKELDKTRKE